MDILGIALLTAGAAVVSTIAGFGVSTIIVPVLALFFPFSQVLLFAGIIHWFLDIWKILLFRQGLDKTFVLRFALPATLTSILGASLVLQVPSDLLIRIVGGGFLAYVIFLFARPTFRIARNLRNELLAGLTSGFVPGLLGVGGEVRSAFLTAFDLPKAAFIFTNGAIAFFIDSARITTYLAEGITIPAGYFPALVVAIPASFFGVTMAKRIVGRIPQKKFRSVVAIILLALSFKLLFF